jgi:hypothetical protein
MQGDVDVEWRVQLSALSTNKKRTGSLDDMYEENGGEKRHYCEG